MAEDEFISTTEAAEQLGITRQRVLQLIEGGRLDAKKFASVYMIRRASLANVEDRKPGRPPKQPADTTKQLNAAFRQATDRQSVIRKADGFGRKGGVKK